MIPLRGRGYCSDGSSMSMTIRTVGGMFYTIRTCELYDDGRRCRRCTRRSQVFGDEDPESGYVGYCAVCTLDWYTWQLEVSVRLCDRRCAVHCITGILPEKRNIVTLLIRGFLLGDCSVAGLEMELTVRRRFHLLLLSWLVCTNDWWPWYFLQQDGTYERPILYKLTQVCVVCGSSASRLVPYRFARKPCSLLELVCAYLYDISCSTTVSVRDTYKLSSSIWHHPEELPMLSVDGRQCDWWMFVHETQRWLWREVSREWFYVQSPPPHWCRYCFIWHWGPFYWWYNEHDACWFFEPSPGACYRGAAIQPAV